MDDKKTKPFPTPSVTPDLSDAALRKAYPDSFCDPHLNPDPEARVASYGKRMGEYVTPKAIDVEGHNYPISVTCKKPFLSKATLQLHREAHWRRFKRSFTRVSRFRVKIAWRQAAESLGRVLKATWKLWTGNYQV